MPAPSTMYIPVPHLNVTPILESITEGGRFSTAVPTPNPERLEPTHFSLIRQAAKKQMEISDLLCAAEKRIGQSIHETVLYTLTACLRKPEECEEITASEIRDALEA